MSLTQLSSFPFNIFQSKKAITEKYIAVYKKSLAKNANILHFPRKQTCYNYHDRLSSFFDLYRKVLCRLAGLPSPIVYLLMGI